MCFRDILKILDSFGMEGTPFECGSIYASGRTRINASLPPLSWQTYDVEFTNAVVENGELVTPATITVRHNGVLIHDKRVLKKQTGGSAKVPVGSPGRLRLQGHKNPLQFRNVWIVER